MKTGKGAHVVAAIILDGIRPDEVVAALKRSIANPSVRDIETEEEMAWMEKEMWERVKVALETEAAWAIYDGRFCPECGGAGEVYVAADTVYPQPAEWAPCPRCNGWGVLGAGGKRIPPIPPRVATSEVPF